MKTLSRFAVECLHLQKYTSEVFDCRNRKAVFDFRDPTFFNLDTFTEIVKCVYPQITNDI